MDIENLHENLQRNIPDELKKGNKWICHKHDKVPVNSLTGGPAMSNNPKTWGAFQEAVKAVQRGFIDTEYGRRITVSGIGYVFNGDGIMGLDIDDCRDPETGTLNDLARDIVGIMDTYTEISPSGRGLHLIFRASFEHNKKETHIEGKHLAIYTSKYFTMTGDVLDDGHADIEERTEQLQQVHKKYIDVQKNNQNVHKNADFVSKSTGFLTENDVFDRIDKSKKRDAIYDLLNGNWKGRYPSCSEADMALMNHLAYYADRNGSLMWSIFSKCGLYREDEYRRNPKKFKTTLERAVQDCQECFSERRERASEQWKSRKRNQDEPPEIDNGLEYLGELPPTSEKEKVYKCTDAGNAERVADMLRRQYVFIPEKKAWYKYNGKLWEEDCENSIVQDTIKCLRKAQQEAFSISDEDRRSKTLKWLIASESQSRIFAALNLMASISFMCARINKFDIDDMLLNVQNGTVDLRTGNMRPHQKEDFFTRICNVEYHTDAKSVIFESFLDEITESKEEKKKYLQKLCGYFLTGKITEEQFYQAKGSGQNGKTKLFETIKYVLGSYSVSASPDILMAKDMMSIPNDIARLHGARFVLMSEPDPGKRFSDNAIKSLTGGDTIIARFLHREFFEFQMKAKMLMLTNHEIKAIGTDHGLWRRMVIIPFNYQVPEEKKDKNLQEKLIADAEAVLAWMVRGCLMWQQEGLEQPQELIEVKNEYKRGQDAVGLFLDECTYEDPKVKVSATSLYKAYIQWCQSTGEYEISQRLFGSRLREKGFTNVKSGTVYWFGLNLLDSLDKLDKKQVNTKIKFPYKDFTENCPDSPISPVRQIEIDEDGLDPYTRAHM